MGQAPGGQTPDERESVHIQQYCEGKKISSALLVLPFKPQDKQRRVADELSKMMMEKQKQAKLSQVKNRIEEKRLILKDSRER